jgi:hypothetical protein
MANDMVCKIARDDSNMQIATRAAWGRKDGGGDWMAVDYFVIIRT